MGMLHDGPCVVFVLTWCMLHQWFKYQGAEVANYRVDHSGSISLASGVCVGLWTQQLHSDKA